MSLKTIDTVTSSTLHYSITTCYRLHGFELVYKSKIILESYISLSFLLCGFMACMQALTSLYCYRYVIKYCEISMFCSALLFMDCVVRLTRNSE